MKKVLPLLLFFVFISLPVSAAQKTIHLKDGSVLNGRVISMNNGVYKIETDNLGVVQLKESKVKMISDGSAPAQNTAQNMPSGALAVQTQQMQEMIMGDPKLMEGIQGLANNPNIMNLIKDPTILKDLMSMDEATISNNPAIQKLMNDPQMKALTNQVHKKVAPQK